MEYQAVGTNEDTIAQINERVVLTTAGIAQLKELCDKMEQATRRVVWGICGELGKKGVADFASEQLKTGVDMTKPQPCNMFDVADGEAWAKELGKHMYDVVRDVIYMDQFFDCIERADEEALAEKLTDIITVCTSWIDALGYDETMRGEVQRRVNEKNKKRGYFGSD